jgi:hypothetical protein
LAALSLHAGPALGWIELNPKALVSTLDVEVTGQATVSQELTMEVRGGPLRELVLPIADGDAEPLGEATVKRLPSGLPLPLVVERRPDGSLALEIDHERGLRSGTYLFTVRYRSDFRAQNVLSRKGEAFVLGWVGPRLEGGIDGARTIVRLPSADALPRLPEATPNDETGFGVLVAGVRRTPSGDEIELLRSHVAKGEPPLWRVEASSRAFPGLLPKVDAPGQPERPAPRPVPRVHSPRFAVASALVALVLSLLVYWKAKAHALCCARVGARPRSLIPLPLWLRASLAGLFAGGALFAGAELELPSAAGGLFLFALSFTAHAAPRHAVRPRGPGRWLPLREEDAFAPRRAPIPGAWLDSSSPRGFLLLSALVLVVLLLAYSELSRSPYRALLIVLTSGVALPIFFTGRASDLLGDRVAFSRVFLQRLERKLRGRFRVVPWGRLPDGNAEPDELRLLVKLRDAVDGLVALEVALEPQRGIFAPGAAPFVLVRAREGSAAERALPGAAWTRGRKAEERVVVLSPALPTLGLTISLVERLSARLSGQPPRSARMSSGKPASTRKLATVASPAHAT